MDQFARIDIKMACSASWEKQVNAYLENACECENKKMTYSAKRNLRHAMAIERMHKMVEKGIHPAWSWNLEEWSE